MIPQDQIKQLYAFEGCPTGFFDLEEELYHNGPGISRSMLGWFYPRPGSRQPLPLMFKHNLLNRKPATQAMQLGKLAHRLILEGKIGLPDGWEMKPEGMNFSTKEGKAWRDERQGKTIIAETDWKCAKAMAESVANKPMAQKLLRGAKPEVSAYAVHPATGLLRRCRVDTLPVGDVLTDVKTTESAQPDDFARDIVKYRYHVQAAYSLDVINAVLGKETYKYFSFIVVEKAPPHEVACYYFERGNDDEIEAGRVAYEADLHTLHRCCQTNEWPAYPERLMAITRPAWDKKADGFGVGVAK
jgi:hypothetical protein